MILYPVFSVTHVDFCEDDYSQAEYCGAFSTRTAARMAADRMDVTDDRVYYVGRPIEGIPKDRLC